MTNLELIGLKNATSFTFDKSPIIIGRFPTASIVLRELFVSRTHCDIVLKNKKWILSDKSGSGTYVNNKLVGKGNSTALQNQDIIMLGPPELDNHISWKCKLADDDLDDSMIENSQALIADMQNKKSIAESQMTNTTNEIKRIHDKCMRLNASYENKLKVADETYAQEELLKIREAISAEWASQKNELLEQMAAHETTEKNLKDEVARLELSLENEKSQWQQTISDMELKIQLAVRSKEDAVKATRDEMAASSHHDQELLRQRLQTEEEERKKLSERLQLMEHDKAQFMTHVKAQQARFEREKQLEIQRNAVLIQEYHTRQLHQLAQDKSRVESALKAELEKKHESEREVKRLRKEVCKNNEARPSTTVENFENLLESELQCSICNELFIKPYTLNCSHTFCKYCLEVWTKNKRASTCPVCRTPITSQISSLHMNNLIESMVSKLSEEFKTKRNMIVSERTEQETVLQQAPTRGRQRRQGRRSGRGRGVIHMEVIDVTL